MMNDAKVTTRRWTTVEMVYVAMFSALMMIGANITSFVPFLIVGGVPITLQTFFAVLAGTLLGKRLGALSMIVYALLGLVGAPVFARFSGGVGSILNPTFGFIISFIFTAYVVGWIVEKSQKLSTYIIAALVGTAINYLFGTNWMYVAYKMWAAAPEGFTYKLAWLWMLPPLPKDILLAIFAGWMAYRVTKTMNLRKK